MKASSSLHLEQQNFTHLPNKYHLLSAPKVPGALGLLYLTSCYTRAVGWLSFYPHFKDEDRSVKLRVETLSFHSQKTSVYEGSGMKTSLMY